MILIRAFVGHSFAELDATVISEFIEFFDQMKGALPSFDWTRARAAEPTELAKKVLSLIEGRNVFIGICTKKERVIADEKIHSSWFNAGKKVIDGSDLQWKTSDWIMQEIGLAVGRNMSIVLLIEKGCRRPGGLEGDIEFIEFERSAPAKSFGRILEMMRALSPSPRAGLASSAEASDEVSVEDNQETAGEDLVPDATWDREKYEEAVIWKVIRGDLAGTNQIDEAYRKTPDAVDPEHLASWKANLETWRLRMGQNGSLDTIRNALTEYPANLSILIDLAEALAIVHAYADSAKNYLNAAELARPDVVESERLRGFAATQHKKAGELKECAKILREQRQIIESSPPAVELNYLARAKDLLPESDRKQAEVELLERSIALRPEDWDARFNLAYAYSQMSVDDLALYHYLKIPRGQRSPVTWNNLGVAFHQFGMPAKAVEAYTAAAAKDETLAMSNLAYLHMDAGFVDEADRELQRALKLPDFHKNVGEALAILKVNSKKEDEKLEDVLNKCAERNTFLRKLGQAITSPDVENIASNWIGPRCNITLCIEQGKLTGTGEFETPVSALAGLLMPTQKVTKSNVRYSGEIIGRRVLGLVSYTKSGIGESAGASSLLGDESDIGFGMLIDPEKGEILVAERLFTRTPKFYSLRANQTTT